MEPVDGARDLGNNLRQTIVPFYMRKLVHQDYASSLAIPFVRSRRKNNDRTLDSPRCRHCCRRAYDNAYVTIDPELAPELRQSTIPLKRNRLRLTGHFAENEKPSDERDESDDDAAEPDECERFY